MQRFQSLRDSAYGVTYAQTYLAQGRYAEAIASTGAEPELVNAATPQVDVRTRPPRGSRRTPSTPRRADAGVTLFDATATALSISSAPGGRRAAVPQHGGRFTDDTAAPADAARAARGRDRRRTTTTTARPICSSCAAAATAAPQQADGRSRTSRPRPALPGAAATRRRTAAFADVDHDGDLDIVVAGGAAQAAAQQRQRHVHRHHGRRGLAAAAPAHGSRSCRPTSTTAATSTCSSPPRAAAGAVPEHARRHVRGCGRAGAGSSRPRRHSALAAGDVNKDGYTDFFFGRRRRPASSRSATARAVSRGARRRRRRAGAVAAQFVDYDNDGLLDLLVARPQDGLQALPQRRRGTAGST